MQQRVVVHRDEGLGLRAELLAAAQQAMVTVADPLRVASGWLRIRMDPMGGTARLGETVVAVQG